MPLTLSYAHAVKTIIEDDTLDIIRDTADAPQFQPLNNTTQIEQTKKGTIPKPLSQNEPNLFEHELLHHLFSQSSPRNYTIQSSKNKPIQMNITTSKKFSTAVITIDLPPQNTSPTETSTININAQAPTMLVLIIKSPLNTNHKLNINILTNNNPIFITQQIIVAKNSHVANIQTIQSTSELLYQRTTANIDQSATYTEQTYATTSKTGYIDIKTESNLHAEYAKSYIHFKGIVYDAAKMIQQSNAIVHKNANNSIAKEKSEILIINPTGKAESIPQLIVYNDNTQCSHAGSITQINPEKIFFLESRGLTKIEAEQMIIDGFIHPNESDTQPNITTN